MTNWVRKTWSTNTIKASTDTLDQLMVRKVTMEYRHRGHYLTWKANFLMLFDVLSMSTQKDSVTVLKNSPKKLSGFYICCQIIPGECKAHLDLHQTAGLSLSGALFQLMMNASNL